MTYLRAEWLSSGTVRWTSLNGCGTSSGPRRIHFFVRRKNESPKTLTYRSGEQVELEDIVMRSENSNTKGVVVKVILPFSPDAIWYEVRLGGVVVKWGSLETEGTLSSDVLREEVYLVFRKSE